MHPESSADEQIIKRIDEFCDVEYMGIKETDKSIPQSMGSVILLSYHGNASQKFLRVIILSLKAVQIGYISDC